MENRIELRVSDAATLSAQLTNLRSLCIHLEHLLQFARTMDPLIEQVAKQLGAPARKSGELSRVELMARVPELLDSVALLSLDKLQEELGISRGTLMKVRRSPTFPKPVHVSGRKKAYVRADIKEWIRNGGMKRF